MSADSKRRLKMGQRLMSKKLYQLKPKNTRVGQAQVIVIMITALLLSGCVNSLSKSRTGIFDMREKSGISVSEKYSAILAVDDTRRQFSMLEMSEMNAFVFRVVGYDGQDIERKAINSKIFSWMYRPSLSPDGRRIAFYSNDAICIYDLENSTEKVVLRSKSRFDILIVNGGMKWVSNSEIIILGTIESMDNAHIVKYDVDKESVVKVIKFEYRPDYFIWPEKKCVGLVISDKHLNYEIKIFDPVKMEVVQTIKPEIPQANISGLCVSPSGRRLAYTEGIHMGPGNIRHEVKMIDLTTGEWMKYPYTAGKLKFLDEDTLVYAYYSWSMPPFMRSVRKIDLKYGFAKTLFRFDEPPSVLIGVDGGKKLLFSGR